MRGGIGVGLVVVGLVLLWVLVTGRTGNFAAAWSALKGTSPAPGTASAPTGPPTWGSVTQKAWDRIWHPPTLPTP